MAPRDNRTAELSSQQILLVQQTNRLMRRIRRLQGKQLQRCFDKQLKAFVEHEQKATGINCQRFVPRKEFEMHSTPLNSIRPQLSLNDVDDKMKLLTPEGVKGLSTSALVNLVKRLESSGSSSISQLASGNNSTNSHLKQRLTSSPLPSRIPSQLPHVSDSSSSYAETTLVKLLQKNSPNVNQVQRLNQDEIEPIKNTLGLLRTNIINLESGYDSDITESSSGGESCDECDDYSLSHSNGYAIPLQKRAGWKWAIERGAIAARWTWLQAQVADLEFRIRQQNEMYRQLRATKGTIAFSGRDNSVSKNNSVPAAIPPSTSTASSVPVNQAPLTPNTNVSSGEQQCSSGTVNSTTPNDDDCVCVRTLPLKQMRKRKLVRSSNALAGATRKAAKYSTVQCACNGLSDTVSPCVLCNGRYSYVQVIDTDCMSYFERVALLDSTCHSVLSLHNDVSFGLHFSELLKRETIQKPVSSRLLNKKKRSPSSPVAQKHHPQNETKKNLKRSQAVISSNKLRKKYDGTTKRKYVRRSHPNRDGSWKKRGRPRENSSSGSSRNESPIPSPAASDGSISGVVHNNHNAQLNRRRRSEQQFDINNIVIPYSIAATTRVEKLQYKEITTPKWCINDISDRELVKPIEDDEIEDLSDAIYAERHQRCETEEKKRILAFLKGGQKGKKGGNANVVNSRGRISRVRFDNGRTESVGSNSSVCAGEVVNNFDSTSQDSFTSTPVAITPPATPGGTNATEQHTPTINSEHTSNGKSSKVNERRRTTSSSSKRHDSVDDESQNEIVVPSYERRRFPLCETDFESMQTSSNHLDENNDELVTVNGDPEKSNEGTLTADDSRAASLSPSHSDAGESVAENVDDVEDPEWEPEIKKAQKLQP